MNLRFETAWCNLTNLLSRMRKKRHGRAKRRVVKLYEQDRLHDAANVAIEFALAYPESFFFPYKAGAALRKLGHEEEACHYFSRALALRPNHAGAASQLVDTIAASKSAAALAEEFSHSLSKACASVVDSAAVNRLLSVVAPGDLAKALQIFSQYYRAAGISPEILIGPVRTVRDWATFANAPLIEAGEIEMIPYKPPIVYGAPSTPEIIYRQSNKPYVAEIPNARVFSHSSLVLAPDGAILSDDAAHEEFGGVVSYKYERKLVLRERDRMLLDLTKYRNRNIKAAAFLAGAGSESFGHWIPDFMPRIEFFRCHPDFKKLPIIVDSDMPKSHFEFLRRVVDNEFILLQPDESLICDRLLIASSPAFLPLHLTVGLQPHEVPGLSPRALRFLQDELPIGDRVKPFRRIFLARANMQWRRLINENEVVAALARLGFEIIYLENMSAAIQIEVFQQAEWIVAPNGSALLNTIFATPAAKILVISQPNLFNWGTLQGPLEALGYHPLFVCGEDATDRNDRQSDYSVSPELVIAALQYMGWENQRQPSGS